MLNGDRVAPGRAGDDGPSPDQASISTANEPPSPLPSQRRRALLALPACFGLVAVARGAKLEAAASADSARPIVLGTSTPGGGFALYGDVLARTLNRQAGRTLVVAQPSRGSTENIAALEAGRLDAGLVQGTAASEIFAAQADPPAGSRSRLRILFAMYPSPALLAVPAASAAVRLLDLVGRRVVFGVRTSGLVTLARQVFGGLGLDLDRDFTAIYVDEAAESPRLVLSGQADALWGAGEGWPGFVRLAEAPGGARFLAPDRSQIARIVARYPRLTAMDVAAGAYPSIDRPLPTVGSINWILTRDDLDDALAAAFVAAMEASRPALAAALPQAAFGTLANTLEGAPSPALLHRVLRPG